MKKELIAAVQRGDETRVKSLLDQGADVNAKDQYNQTALSGAAGAGHAGIVRLLLDAGASLEVAGDWPVSWAISHNHTEVVALLLNAGQPGRAELVTHAAADGQFDVLELLLDAGIGAHTLSGDRCTPLHYLAQYGPDHASPMETRRVSALVKRLIEAGAVVDHVDNFGDTALMCAARARNLPMVEALLDHGANPALEVCYRGVHHVCSGDESKPSSGVPGVEPMGRTAIGEAKHPEIIHRLLHEAIPQAQIEAALARRLLAGEEWVAKELVKGVDANTADLLARGTDLMRAGRYMTMEGFKGIVRSHAHGKVMRWFGTAVMYKAMDWSGDTRQRVEWLLECGAPPDGPGHGIPLVKAVERRDMAVVELLLAAGANPNAGAGQTTPLLAALRMDRMRDDRTSPAKKYDNLVGALVETLLAAGADPSLAGAEGLTPLHVAVALYPPHVPQLLHAGAAPNAPNNYGYTPLFFADTASARQMLEHGANPNVRNDKGMTPLFVAASTTKAALLVQYGAEPAARGNQGETALMEQASMGRLPLVKWLVTRKGVAGAVSDNGDTALLLAAGGRADDEKTLELCRLLARKGENLQQVNDRGQNALIRACMGHKPRTLEWILARGCAGGCDVNQQDSQGMTALMFAAQWGTEEMVHLLLKNGADRSLVNKLGQTAVDLAQAAAKADVCLLLEGGP